MIHFALDHALDKQHTHVHRMGAGSMIMAVGVIISKSFHSVEIEIVHYVLDGIGYLIHGVGCIPFVDYMIERVNKE